MNIADHNLRRKFIFAGNSTFTLRSTKTGTHFTYRVARADADDESSPWFVKVLVGQDNTNDYRYAGVIFPDNATVVRKGKKGLDRSAPSMVALNWFLTHTDSELVEFFHEGCCAACGRSLTVPASIVTGFGPTCAKKHGVVYGYYKELIDAYEAEQSANDAAADAYHGDENGNMNYVTPNGHDVNTCGCGDCYEIRCESREAMMRSEYEMDYYSGNE